jgi:hypothetical protein
MITLKQIYDAYPDNDMLPIEIRDDTTLADLEDMTVGDTLFLFLCRELLEDTDATLSVMVERCRTAAADCNAIGDMVDHQLIMESRNAKVASDAG